MSSSDIRELQEWSAEEGRRQARIRYMYACAYYGRRLLEECVHRSKKPNGEVKTLSPRFVLNTDARSCQKLMDDSKEDDDENDRGRF